MRDKVFPLKKSQGAKKWIHYLKICIKLCKYLPLTSTNNRQKENSKFFYWFFRPPKWANLFLIWSKEKYICFEFHNIFSPVPCLVPNFFFLKNHSTLLYTVQCTVVRELQFNVIRFLVICFWHFVCQHPHHPVGGLPAPCQWWHLGKCCTICPS